VSSDTCTLLHISLATFLAVRYRSSSTWQMSIKQREWSICAIFYD